MITFRKLEQEDLEFLNEVRNECAEEYLHDSRKFTLEQTINWFNTTKPIFWIIYVDTKPIGYFRTSNWSETNKNLYIGADLHADYRGKGFGYAAYMTIIPFLFKEYNLHKISLEVLETNQRAINLYKKVGFVVEGIKRDEVYKNGVWVNSIIMSIIAEDYD